MPTGKGPKIETLRGLLENCGNQCAFPGCNHPILNRKNQFIAKLVLIEGDPHAGGRYDPEAEEAVIHRADNLMFLCYRHYIEINNREYYPKEVLTEIKQNHELSLFVNTTSRFSLETISEIQNDVDSPEEQIEQFDMSLINQTINHQDYKEDNDIIRPSAFVKNFKKKKNIKLTKKKEPREIVKGEKKVDDNSAQEMETQFVELKQSVNKLLELVGNIHKSDTRLNRDLKSLIESIDVLGLFTRRFRKLPFSKNPFINRNHETIHILIPKTTLKVKNVIKALEMNVLGKLAEELPEKRQEIQGKLKNLQNQSRIVVKSIRYADKN